MLHPSDQVLRKLQNKIKSKVKKLVYPKDGWKAVEKNMMKPLNESFQKEKAAAKANGKKFIP